MGDYQCAELNIFTLDLVAEASEEATPRGLPAVRVVVDGQPTEVLVDWLDDGWLRVGGPTIVASEVPHALPDPSVKMVVPGRKVDREDLLAAVIPLTEGGRLPRSLPRDLNLTEAFLGLVLLLSEDIEEVALTPLEAPIAAARSMDPGSVASEDVRAAAVRLAPALTTAIPGFVDVGPVKLTAEEFLVVMAIVALDPDAERVDVPVVESPDPYANGLGWGRSGP
jgi:hypothetical protein